MWEEATHKHYHVGTKVEVMGEFKPKYRDFIGSKAVVRKIYGKKIGQDKYKDYIFFLEVEGKDAEETAKFRTMIREQNHRCFTDFLYADDRSLLPCRASHIRFFVQQRYNLAAPNAAAATAAAEGGSKRARDDDSQGGSKKAHLQDDQPLPQNEIFNFRIGDNVEILKTTHAFNKFLGYQGVIRNIIPRRDQNCSLAFWIEIQRNNTGETVPPEIADEITNLNKHFWTRKDFHLSCMLCRADYVVLADPELPDPWTPETWAALCFHDKKMHRKQQQQDKEAATKKEKGGKTRRRLDMDSDSTHKIPHLALVDEKPPAQANSAPSKDERVRHIKYDLMAKAPWEGGEVKPYLYGRKVVFILKGKRGEAITR